MTNLICDRSGNVTGRSGNTTGKVAFRSIHTESLLEILDDAICNEWSSNALRVIIKELHKKGYKQDRLIRMVEKKFGKETCLKITRILFG